jgi:hypothetical protein
MYKLRFLAPIGFLAIPALFGVAVMLLWNWLMPSILGLNTVNFWQSLGIFVLCRILFGGFGLKHHLRHKKFGEGMHGMQNNIREKWLKMTPEERKQFVNNRRDEFYRRDNFNRDHFFGRPERPFENGDNVRKEHE